MRNKGKRNKEEEKATLRMHYCVSHHSGVANSPRTPMRRLVNELPTQGMKEGKHFSLNSHESRGAPQA